MTPHVFNQKDANIRLTLLQPATLFMGDIPLTIFKNWSISVKAREILIIHHFCSWKLWSNVKNGGLKLQNKRNSKESTESVDYEVNETVPPHTLCQCSRHSHQRTNTMNRAILWPTPQRETAMTMTANNDTFRSQRWSEWKKRSVNNDWLKCKRHRVGTRHRDDGVTKWWIREIFDRIRCRNLVEFTKNWKAARWCP